MRPERGCRLAIAGWLVAALVAATAAGIEVRGQVVDEEGAAIAGARVLLVRYEPQHALRSAIFEARELEVEAKAKSGEDGGFAIVAPAGGNWGLRVVAKDRPEVGIGLVPLLESGDLLPISVPAGRTLEVRVESADGSPVADALVMVTSRLQRPRRHYVQRWVRSQPRRVMARSDEQGLARVTVPVGATIRVRAAAPGGGFATRDHDGDGPVTVALAAGPRRIVQVRGASDGEARPGAVVMAESGLYPLGVAGDDGALELVLPASGELVAVTAADEWARSPVPSPASPTSNEKAGAALPPIVLAVEAPTPVSGRVLALAEDGREPLAGALVWERADPANAVRSDGKGRYRLPLFDREGQRVSAAAVGYFQEMAPVAPPAVAAGEGPTLALSAGARLRGKVVDGAGEAVAGAVVRGMMTPQPGRRSPVRGFDSLARSGADGRFALGPLTPGLALQLRVTRDGFAPVEVDASVPAAGTAGSELEVVLRRGRDAYGLVLDEAEQPVVGAEVTLTPAMPSGVSARTVWSRYQQIEPLETSSDGEGRFVFADLAAGRYDLRVRRAGFAPALVPALPVVADGAGDGAGSDLGTLILVPGAALEGRVENADGGAIEGVEIRLRENAVMFGLDRWDDGDGPAAVSDREGRFAVRDLRPGTTVTLEAAREGYVGQIWPMVRVPPEEPLRLVLEPGSTVAGEVVDERGDGIADASLWLEQPPEETHRPGGVAVSTSSMSARADADGRFEIADVGAGVWRLRAAATGYQDTEIERLEVDPGRPPAAVRVVMVPGAVLEGQVLDDSGAPLPGADVAPAATVMGRFGRSRGRYRRTTTDGDGKYRIDGLALGKGSFTASHPAHRRQVRDIEVRPGENRLDFRLERGLEVSGTVVDPSGAPVAGASISARPALAQGFFPGGGEAAVSADDGTFTLTGLGDGEIVVVAEKEGYAAAVTEPAVRLAGASIDGLELRLRVGGAIVGQVLGLDFDDLARVSVMASPAARPASPALGRVDFEGSFRLDNLTPGEWRIFATLGQGLRSIQERVTVPEGGGEVRRDLDFGGGLAVTGRVTQNGRPLAGASVFANGDEDGMMASTMTDAEGRFRLEGLDLGSYELFVSDPRGRQTHRRRLEVAGDLALEIELSDARVSGRVIDAEGLPAAGVELSLHALEPGAGRSFFGGGGTVAHSDGDGRFRIAGLEAGRYRLLASKEGYAAAAVEIDLEAQPEIDGVELRLGAALGLELVVARADGGVIYEVSVAALDAGGQPVAKGSFAVGEDGRFRVPDLPAGSWTLLVAALGGATAALPATVPGPPLHVALPHAGSLDVEVPALAAGAGIGTVTVTDTAGVPYRGLSFGRLQVAWPMLGGHGRVPALPPGTWILRARAGTGDGRAGAAGQATDGLEWTGTVTIAAGQSHKVVLE